MSSKDDLAEWAKSLAFVDPRPSEAVGMFRAFASACRLANGRARVHLVVYVAAGGKVFPEPFSPAQRELFERFLEKSLPTGLILDAWDRYAGVTKLKSGIEGWHVLMTVKQ